MRASHEIARAPGTDGLDQVRDLIRDLAGRVDTVGSLPDVAAELERIRVALWAAMLAPSPPIPEPTPAPSPLLTVEEKAAMLKKSACWVRRAIRRGELPGAKKVGGTWRLPP